METYSGNSVIVTCTSRSWGYPYGNFKEAIKKIICMVRTARSRWNFLWNQFYGDLLKIFHIISFLRPFTRKTWTSTHRTPPMYCHLSISRSFLELISLKSWTKSCLFSKSFPTSQNFEARNLQKPVTYSDSSNPTAIGQTL